MYTNIRHKHTILCSFLTSLVFVVQSSTTEIPLKWSALRNNKSPQIGHARAPCALDALAEAGAHC